MARMSSENTSSYTIRQLAISPNFETGEKMRAINGKVVRPRNSPLEHASVSVVLPVRAGLQPRTSPKAGSFQNAPHRSCDVMYVREKLQ